MIDEIIEYKQLLAASIASGRYHSLRVHKDGETSYPFKVKKSDKRTNPPSKALLIIRYFLFKGINDWSSISFEEREERIKKAKIAFFCWLGDEKSYSEGRELLGDDFDTLVENNKGAYQIFCDNCKQAEKLAANRTKVIDSLKKKGDFFKDKKVEGRYDYAPYRFDTLIPNAIALGPLKSYIIGFKKSEVVEMLNLLCSYEFVVTKYLNTIKNNYWANLLLLSVYLKLQQVRYFKGDIDKYIDISNEEILSLLDKNEKYLNFNSLDDIKFNLKLISSSIASSQYREENEDVDYAFDHISNKYIFNSLWRPKAKITKYIYLFESMNEIENKEEYILIDGQIGPNYIDVFVEVLKPYILLSKFEN